ncbi:MAG: alpha/beta hydrolase family protein [Christensenellales bacterium]
MKKLIALVLIVLCVLSMGVAAEKAGYVETVIDIDADDHIIPATLCVPAGEGKFPAVVMLHGTGSNREEAGNGYKTAAPVLAEKYGLATIRIDFIGCGDSTGDYKDYTFDSAVADAVAAVNYLKTLDNIDGENIGIMGWSQGGTNALMACANHPELFKTIVTWAGAPDMTIMLTEEQYNEAKENGFYVMEFGWRDPLNFSLQWCEDVMNTDVLAEFAAFEGPVLAINGSEDTVVDPEWADKIVAANKNDASKTYIIEGMDHTFNVFTEPEFNALLDAVGATGKFFAENLR